jgi:hypothetical protein
MKIAVIQKTETNTNKQYDNVYDLGDTLADLGKKHIFYLELRIIHTYMVYATLV